MIIIPLVSSVLYRLGGADQMSFVPFKQSLFRSFIGIPIGLFFAWHNHSWIPLICILIYWSQLSYGENSYLNFLGEYGKFAVCGLYFGLCSIPALGLYLGIVQGVVSMLAFLIIKYLDDKNIVKNPFVELLRGLFGTICYIWG